MAETKVLKKTHPLSELDAKMNPAVLEKARKMAQKESLNIRLAILREKYGIKQNEVSNFSQTAVSKLGNGKDIRISYIKHNTGKMTAEKILYKKIMDGKIV